MGGVERSRDEINEYFWWLDWIKRFRCSMLWVAKRKHNQSVYSWSRGYVWCISASRSTNNRCVAKHVRVQFRCYYLQSFLTFTDHREILYWCDLFRSSTNLLYWWRCFKRSDLFTYGGFVSRLFLYRVFTCLVYMFLTRLVSFTDIHHR